MTELVYSRIVSLLSGRVGQYQSQFRPASSQFLGALLYSISCYSSAGCMDTDNLLWKNAASQQNYDKLMSLMSCPVDADTDTGIQVDSVACNYFVARTFEKLYGVHDFSPDGGGAGKWLTANQIADYVRSNSEIWSKLGSANDQAVLADAAQGAANGQPVLAVLKGDPHGHVAVILGGALQPSTTWKDIGGKSMRVPNSAAFSLNNVAKAYVFCRLSAAFSDPSLVEVYWRVK